jgi:2'-hydroxyisoflavone reductase
MKLLILGGTRFLGLHLALLALARGHGVTLLHRGRSAAATQPLLREAEHRVADRDDPRAFAAALGDARWDAVIDTSAYVPRQVRLAAGLLASRTAHYQLVSSISVYAEDAPPPLTEDSPRASLAEPDTEQITGATYGGLKALCETAAQADWAGSQLLVVRPGLIVGPHDPTGRFSWWMRRMARGGQVLAPGDPAAPVQFIDVRDLAAWMLDQAEQRATGVVNLTGPAAPLTMGGFLETTRQVLGPSATLVWRDEATLLAAGVAPWTELPLWLPAAQSTLHRCSIAKALSRGLKTRPLAETVADTAAWLATLPGAFDLMPPQPAGGPARPAPGLDAAREADLLGP